MFGFDDRTRALLRGVASRGSVAAAAGALGLDASNARRHLATAARRHGARLVTGARGGAAGSSSRLTAAGRRFVQDASWAGRADAFDPETGCTPVRLGRRVLLVAGRVRPGPVALRVPPEGVVLRRGAPGTRASSAQNAWPVRVAAIAPAGEGRYRVALEAGAWRFESLVVRQAVRALRLRRGSRVVAEVKATAIEASPLHDEGL